MKFKIIVLLSLLLMNNIQATDREALTQAGVSFLKTAQKFARAKGNEELFNKATEVLKKTEQLTSNGVAASIAKSTTDTAIDAVASVSTSVGFLKAFSDSFAKDGDMKTAAGAAIAYVLKKTLRDEALNQAKKGVIILKNKWNKKSEEKKDDKAVLPEQNNVTASNK